MITIFDTLYLISVLHKKKGTLVQSLVNGTMRDSGNALKAIIFGHYKGRTKHLRGSTVIISNDAIAENANGEIINILQGRNLDDDVYMVHCAAGGPAMRCICAGSAPEAWELKKSLEANDKNAKCFINKVSYRSISLVHSDGSEERVRHTDFKYDNGRKSGVYIDELGEALIR